MLSVDTESETLNHVLHIKPDGNGKMVRDFSNLQTLKRVFRYLRDLPNRPCLNA